MAINWIAGSLARENTAARALPLHLDQDACGYDISKNAQVSWFTQAFHNDTGEVFRV